MSDYASLILLPTADNILNQHQTDPELGRSGLPQRDRRLGCARLDAKAAPASGK